MKNYKQLVLITTLVLIGCSDNHTTSHIAEVDLKDISLYNKAAYIPSMCYTKTEDENAKVHNPCFACHTNSIEPNFNNDGDLQIAYLFPKDARKNHFTNLFVDRSEQVNKISDEEIQKYIRTSNYFDKDGNIILEKKLKNLSKEWDIFDSNKWYGYIPDCYFNFDSEGFDKNPKTEQYTGWRAFLYTPFLGTFWPTNGSTDDVMIRLDESFRKDSDGNFDIEIYKLNLSIVEALILRKDINISTVDENNIGYDLNQNGILDIANQVVFNKDNMHFVGQAGVFQDNGDIKAVAGLFPIGTEFVHSVRYVDVDDDGNVHLSKRMKELRYGKKYYWVEPDKLKEMAESEAKDLEYYPDQLRQFDGNIEVGLDNKQGWFYQGFIEDANGDLRPQSYEETMLCIGCHSGLGATTDSVFAFPRKLNGKNIPQEGWAYANSLKEELHIPEPKRLDGRYEYSFYLQQNSAGDEFRENSEVMNKFFDADGVLKDDMIQKLHKDINTLIMPSKKRALLMDKAYRVIVKEQSFIFGRDATIKPVKNVYRELSKDQLTGIETMVNAQ
jgi:hypothetical protein